MAQEMARVPSGPDPAALDAIQANALSQLDAIAVGVQALEAYRLRLLAALGHLGVERARVLGGDVAMHVRSVAAEVGVRMRLSDRTVEAQLSEAMDLVDSWPTVVDAFATARIGRGHLRVIVEAGGPLATSEVDPEQRAAYAAEMIALAETTTPARVRRVARRRADAFLAEPIAVRHRRARDDRHVRVSPGDDGMAHVHAFVPAVLAAGIEHRLLAGARSKADDDPRTIDQWRADAFCELLLTGSGAATSERTDSGEAVERPGLLGAIAAVVQITIPVTTLTGAGDRPATLDGVQPVDPETARALAGGAATWERLLTDPIDGTVLEVDAYRPSAAQLRHLRARDRSCRFPGCGAQARQADVDHTIAWSDGGTTSLGNLASLCRRHHTLKHATAWTVSQPHPGELHWASPLGHAYVDRPPPSGPTFVEPEPAALPF
ncbi:HNH endonuclease signature motif containing protein [Agrococcus versicolor]|uniref:HNH endonuclease signature motif containing protein n=1 Tax=Agrococcus versicolor TaxID=501482 RepID=A0ABN3APR1_9MICO